MGLDLVIEARFFKYRWEKAKIIEEKASGSRMILMYRASRLMMVFEYE